MSFTSRLLALLVMAPLMGCTDGEQADNRMDAPVANSAQQYGYTPVEERKYPAISSPDAPTLGELKKHGLEVTGHDIQRFACGPSCDGGYIYAIFAGRRATYAIVDKLPGREARPDRKYKVRTSDVEHLYTCPRSETSLSPDEWKCGKFTGFKGQG